MRRLPYRKEEPPENPNGFSISLVHGISLDTIRFDSPFFQKPWVKKLIALEQRIFARSAVRLWVAIPLLLLCFIAILYSLYFFTEKPPTTILAAIPGLALLFPAYLLLPAAVFILTKFLKKGPLKTGIRKNAWAAFVIFFAVSCAIVIILLVVCLCIHIGLMTPQGYIIK